jgi:hypothetical protein
MGMAGSLGTFFTFPLMMLYTWFTEHRSSFTMGGEQSDLSIKDTGQMAAFFHQPGDSVPLASLLSPASLF